jgi:DNA-binding GntR family transcriptional regulator
MISFQHTKIVHEMPENCAFRFIGRSIINKEVVHATCRRTGDDILMTIDGHKMAYNHTPDTLHDEFDDHIYRVVAHPLTDWQKDHLAVNAARAEGELLAINEHFDVSEAIARIIDIRKHLEE